MLYVVKEMMGEYRKVKSIKRNRKSRKCFTDEQEAETTLVKINKYRRWKAEVYHSYLRKQHWNTQNNTGQQNATKDSIKSYKQNITERTKLERLKEDIQYN